MISHSAFTVELWAIHETELDTGVLAQSESVLALSNGHLGLRGNLDEGEPHGCRAPTSTRSMRPGRCHMPRSPTAIRSRARQ